MNPLTAAERRAILVTLTLFVAGALIFTTAGIAGAGWLPTAISSESAQAPTACFEVVAKRTLSVWVDASCSQSASDLTYSWSWGDGEVTDGGPEASHAYVVCPSGRFPVTLTVTDELGVSSVASRSVSIADADRDRDRLARCREIEQGSTDRNPDRDGDGLTDLIESIWWKPRDLVFCGSRCAYPNPLTRDLYVEIDRMRTRSKHAHSHRIPRALVESITGSFARNGVNLHIDQGAFGGGEVIRHHALFKWNSAKTDHADRYYNRTRSRGFSQARRGIFHYAIVAHAFAGDASCRIVGLGEAPTGHEKRYGDFLVIFRACLDGFGDEGSGLAHVFLQELGHNLFGLIEPEADRFPCPHTSGVDPFHDRFYGNAMWPYLGGGGATYHPNRWQHDMNDMGKSLREKLGARYHVNKMFVPGPTACG